MIVGNIRRAAATATLTLVGLWTPCAHDAFAQATWYVDDDCSPPGSAQIADPFCAIQAGIDAAQDGDSVLVGPGTYTGFGNRDVSLFGKVITLKSSAGAAETILDIQGGPSSIHRGFFLIHGETKDTVIEGFTIKNGYLIGNTGGSGPSGGGGGAGIYVRDSSPTIRRCTVINNVSAQLGSPFVHDGRGAGIYIDGNSSAIIDGCVIANNSSDNRGGGLYVGYATSNVALWNCVIAGNSASNGGGVHIYADISILNTVVASNTSVFGGGGIACEQGVCSISNCILWGNQGGTVGPQVFVSGPIVIIKYSDVKGGLADVYGCCGYEIEWGPGNIDTDPLFVYPENDDFRLLHGSPCIDAGNNLALPIDVTTDLDDDPRFLDDPDSPDTGNPDGIHPIVDMGPYEYDPNDCNNNDTPDAKDIANGQSTDCNGNGLPDECEAECNSNSIPDECDIADGTSQDCNGNGVPDGCDIASGTSKDCNDNGVADECDIAAGTSQDCNGNGVPDGCDIASGTSQDCDTTGVPDECEQDCNGNGQADTCDIAGGLSEDCNENGVPDECPYEPTPDFIVQPEDVEVKAGGFVGFVVNVSAVLPFYQWRKDRQPLVETKRILGTNGPSLLILDVMPSDSGIYDCVVTDFFGCAAISSPAVLTVIQPCPADLTSDGVVDAADLALLLGAWGASPSHPADLTNDGVTNAADLALLLGAWGPCPT